MSLGKRIQKLRKEKHMTQEQLADLLLVSRQAISKWESDLNEPDIKTLIKLSEIFQISIDELIKGNEIEIKENKKSDDNNLNQEILMTNKKNHRLLIFIVGFVICFLFIFIICPLFSQMDDGTADDSDTKITNISESVFKDKDLIHELGFEVQITNYKEAKMLLKGYLNLISMYKNETDGKLTITYDDKTQEILDIFESLEAGQKYVFQKEIPAKNIETITIDIAGKNREYKTIAFPIEEYMYGIEWNAALRDDTKDSFIIELSQSFLQNIQGNGTIYERFEDCIQVVNADENMKDLFDYITDCKATITKNNHVIQEVDLDDMDEIKHIVITEAFEPQSKYEIELSYQTPLHKTINEVIVLN